MPFSPRLAPHLNGRILTPDEIVDIVLNGTLISTAKETH